MRLSTADTNRRFFQTVARALLSFYCRESYNNKTCLTAFIMINEFQGMVGWPRRQMPQRLLSRSLAGGYVLRRAIRILLA